MSQSLEQPLNGGGDAPRPVLQMNVQSVRRAKAASFIADELRRTIVRDGEPGEYLMSERQLLEQFGVSRPTLREGLRILESEGLLEMRRGTKGGAVVRQPSIHDLAMRVGTFLQLRRATYNDLFLVRKVLEPAGARNAATHVGAGADPSALDRCLEHERQTITSPETSRDLSRSIAGFHDVVLELSGSTTLAVLGKLLDVTVDAHTSAYIRSLPSIQESVKQMQRSHRAHQRIAAAIKAADGDRAERLMLEHLSALAKETGRATGDRCIDVFGDSPGAT